MSYFVITMPDCESLGVAMAGHARLLLEEPMMRSFPDGETYLRLHSRVVDRIVFILSSLHPADEKILPIVFLSEELRKRGAEKVVLIAPYLAYMRQDKEFQEGELVTAGYFARLISRYFDGIITVDPHLHRIKSLADVYTIPALNLQSAPFVAAWLKQNVGDAVIIGPDEESRQWVTEVAKLIDAPVVVLKKIRTGDKTVEVSMPDLRDYKDRSPVLIDDIISTARTMSISVRHLLDLTDKRPVCIGVHGIFAGDAYEILQQTGAEIVSCNTIPHPTNRIDISPAIVDAMGKFME